MPELPDYIPAEAFNLIKKWEGFRTKAYQDGGGVWTIGYGFTGDHVVKGMVITKEAAEQMLIDKLKYFCRSVYALLNHEALTTKNQYAAMISLAYNIGLGSFRNSTLLKKHNASKNTDAAAQFLVWRLINGEPSPGLLNRRTDERALYCIPTQPLIPPPSM